MEAIMRIYLVRHGETISNRKRFILGRDDSPLTRAGRESMRALACALKSQGAAKLVCSPLGRATASAAIMAEALGLGCEEMPELVNLSAGQFDGKSRKVFLPPGERLRQHWDDRPADGESYADGEERAAEALSLLAKLAQAGPVIAVGHLALGRVMLRGYLGLAGHEALAIGQPLGAAYVLENGAVGFLTAEGGGGQGLLPFEAE
jgi:broad specificity phosphatase PhoE